MEIDLSTQIKAKKNKNKAPLNKPFRLPSGSKKKFGVYVKNDKGNIVKVTFGDPNMSIKRDDPARRKAFRSRHGCDNPGPKYKANYWSCKMWSATPVSKITGSCGKPNCGSVQVNEEDFIFEVEVKAQGKGLWYNIQQKKKRMGKNYKPAKKGSKDRPSQEALKRAQGSDYLNENYEWDGETEFDQNELLKIDASLSQAQEIEEELEDYKEDFQESNSSMMFKVGDKVKNVNAECKHYGSEGIVKEIRDLPEDMGYAVVYECTNDGSTWKKGDMLGKTEIQLVKASEKYQIEADEEYKNMMTIEGEKFNEFLKKCVPTKKGDDKSKFKSCLEDYKKNK